MFDHAPPTAGEVRALAHQLLTWAEQLSAMPSRSSALSEEDRHELALARAETARLESRLRSRIFAGVPFGNVNWDLMLELFIREMTGFRVSVDDLLAEDLFPRDLVVRSLDALAELSLVEKVADRFDRRVAWITLSAAGKQGMIRFLLEAPHSNHARRQEGEASPLSSHERETSAQLSRSV
jgi:hypothetical protein